MNIGIVFPGNGTYYSQMGKSLLARYPNLLFYSERAEELAGFPFFNTEARTDLDHDFVYTQMATYVYSFCCWEVFKKESPFRAAALSGHSLGEITALAASGIIDFETGLKLVRKRAQLILENSDEIKGRMSVIRGIDSKTCEVLLAQMNSSEKVVWYSGKNADNEHLITVRTEYYQQFTDLAFQKGGELNQVTESIVSHCEWVDSLHTMFKDFVSEIEWNEPEYKVLSNVKAQLYTKENAEELIAEQLKQSVCWLDQMHLYRVLKVDTLVELGPQVVLSFIGKSIHPDWKTYSFDIVADLKSFIQNSKPFQPNWKQITDQCYMIALTTPNLNTQSSVFEEQVIPVFRQLQADYFSTEKIDFRYTTQQILNHTAFILNGKGISQEEIEQKIQQIIIKGNASQFLKIEERQLIGSII